MSDSVTVSQWCLSCAPSEAALAGGRGVPREVALSHRSRPHSRAQANPTSREDLGEEPVPSCSVLAQGQLHLTSEEKAGFPTEPQTT